MSTPPPPSSIHSSTRIRVSVSTTFIQRTGATIWLFRASRTAQRFLSVHAAYITFNVERHLITRRTLRAFRSDALEQWQSATAAA